MPSSRTIIIIVLGAILIFGVGYYAGKAQSHADARAIKKSLAQEILGGSALANNLSGEVVAVQAHKNALTVKVPSVYGVTLPQEYQQKDIVITGQTKITMLENKDPQVFVREMEQARKQAGAIFTPPLPYTQKEITLGELKGGDKVDFVFAPQAGLTILDTHFTATQVTVRR